MLCGWVLQTADELIDTTTAIKKIIGLLIWMAVIKATNVSTPADRISTIAKGENWLTSNYKQNNYKYRPTLLYERPGRLWQKSSYPAQRKIVRLAVLILSRRRRPRWRRNTISGARALLNCDATVDFQKLSHCIRLDTWTVTLSRLDSQRTDTNSKKHKRTEMKEASFWQS